MMMGCVRGYLDVMADHRDDSPKNKQGGQDEDDNGKYFIPKFFPFLPDLFTFQLFLAGLMYLRHGLLRWCCLPGNH